MKNLVTSRILYGFPYTRTTVTVRRRVEAAHRQNTRMAYGLPKDTPNYVLYSESQIKTLEKLGEDARRAHVLRLAATSSGRRILA